MEQFKRIDFERDARYYRVVIYILFFVMSLIPLLAVLEVLKPENESSGIWLQRSGSLVVLLASLAEYFAFKMHGVFSPEYLTNEPLFNTKLKYCLQAKRLMAVAALFIGLGTIIWGYGDLFFYK